MWIHRASLLHRPGLFDVQCVHGRVGAVQPAVTRAHGDGDIDACGGVLLPGLHDHHLHLFALAAMRHSVQCGPPAVTSRTQLQQRLRQAPGGDWVRGVAYHESVAGELDRNALDALVPDRPLRLQHRSGMLWMLNSAAIARLDLDNGVQADGVERDASGRVTGRLFRLDDWLGQRLSQHGERVAPSLAPVSELLAAYGVIGVTDASADNDAAALDLFERARMAGEWRQRLRLMGGFDLPATQCADITRGEVKVLLDERDLPDWDSLAQTFRRARAQQRKLAVHCVTSAELVFTLAVLRDVGGTPGDRIEHGSQIPAQVLPLLADVGVRVVTQPGFIAQRGDSYCRDIASTQWHELYRCQQLLDHGIPLAGSTDAPYGEPDPWAAMHAAVFRQTRTGRVLGPRERLQPEQALALFTCPAHAPGAAPVTVEPGVPADLCLLRHPWSIARQRLHHQDVFATLVDGEPVFLADSGSEVASDETAVA